MLTKSVSYERDLKALQARLDKNLKKVDPTTGRPKESDVVGVVRSAVRKSWMRAPSKLSFIQQRAVHVEDVPLKDRPPKLSKISKWLYKCEMCLCYHIAKNIEVDHREGEHSLKHYHQMEAFTRGILDVGWEDLSLLCVDCHSVKSYSERYNVTIEQAKKEKVVIEVMNTKAKGQKSFLVKHGVKPASNEAKRREQIRDIVTKGVER